MAALSGEPVAVPVAWQVANQHSLSKPQSVPSGCIHVVAVRVWLCLSLRVGYVLPVAVNTKAAATE